MLNPQADRPILVTGSHRSGTTWISQMLALASNALLIEEPFNLDSWAYKLDGLAKWWFTYVPGLPRAHAVTAFDKVLCGRTGKVFSRRAIQRYLPWTRYGRMIIKDPTACFSSDWLYENYRMEVLVIVRHPAAFAASLKRMNWTFSFQHLLQQERLMNDHLFPFRSEMEAGPKDVVEQAALLWKMIYHVLTGFAAKHPDWIIVTHESLSLNPVQGFKQLFERFGLEWSESTRREIEEYSSARNPTDPAPGVAHVLRRNSAENVGRWRTSLSRSEIQHIFDVCHPIARKFYDAASLQP
jgi:sulfotransferase family protein